MKQKKQPSRMRLVLHKDPTPKVELRPGMKIQVEEVELLGGTAAELKKIGARLCGGSSTCLAIIDIGSDVINPDPTAEQKPTTTATKRVTRSRKKKEE